jgi:hypothetical protein
MPSPVNRDIMRDLENELVNLHWDDEDAFEDKDYDLCRQIRDEIMERQTMLRLYKDL